MAQVNCREAVLLASQTITANGTGNDNILPQGYTSAIVTLACGTVSGTSPTLNVYIQNKLPQAAAADAVGTLPTGTAVYDDLLAFGQLTASSQTRVFRIVGGGNTENALSNGALTASSARSGPIGGTWNVKWTVGGTSPSFGAVTVTVELIP